MELKNVGQFPSTHTPSSERRNPVVDPVGINKSTIRYVLRARKGGHLKGLESLVDFRNILRHLECLFLIK